MKRTRWEYTSQYPEMTWTKVPTVARTMLVQTVRFSALTRRLGRGLDLIPVALDAGS